MTYQMTVAPAHVQNDSAIPSVCKRMFEAKQKLGLSFEKIAAECGRGEVYIASVFYGQLKPDDEDITKLGKVLQIDPQDIGAELGAGFFPHRGLGQMPPTDPTIYRLYEVILVHGNSLKSIIHEKFGDGIMSAINFKLDVKKTNENGEDRVNVHLNGKWLPYTKF